MPFRVVRPGSHWDALEDFALYTGSDWRLSRAAILASARQLFIDEGYEINLEEVAAHAGVTKRTLYYHFKSKDDLVAAYLAGRDQPNLALFKQWFDEADGALPVRVERLNA